MKKQCSRCLLVEHSPHIKLGDDGVCNVCASHKAGEEAKELISNAFMESEFYKTLQEYRNHAKSKNKKYDCLVMCSGGKDSTLALYYIKKKYKLNPLAYTFDHGFENDEAIKNIRNATNILGVDWILVKSDFMRDAFNEMIKTSAKASICHICSIWYIQLTLDVAKRFETPLIVAGWTKGQSTGKDGVTPEYMPISHATKDFLDHLRTIPKYKDFPKSVDAVIKSANENRGMFSKEFKILSPHWFLQQVPDDMLDVLKKELKWEAPKLSYPKGSTNCLLNYASVFLTMRDFGYTHYHIEASKLIRKGLLSKLEAEKKLEIDFDKDFVNNLIKGFGYKIE